MAESNVDVPVWMRDSFIMVLCIVLLSLPVFAASPDKDMAGIWQGTLKTPDGAEINVNLEFYKSEEGEDRLFLVLPEQDNVFNITSVTLTSDSLRFDSEDMNLTFAGSVKRGEQIKGAFEQGEATMPISFLLDDD